MKKFNLSHNDIKPQNYLLKHENESIRVVLSDFGLEGETNGGTPIYTAPESCNIETRTESRKTGASDLFSLGMVFLYLLTGDEFNVFVLFPIPPFIQELIEAEIMKCPMISLVKKMICLRYQDRIDIDSVVGQLQEFTDYCEKKLTFRKLRTKMEEIDLNAVFEGFSNYDSYFQRYYF